MNEDLIHPEQSEASATDSQDTARILQETDTLEAATPQETGGEDHTENTAPQGINVLSIISLVLALTASPLTVLFGYIAVGQIRRANQKGEALAWTAVALGWFWLVVWIVAGAVAALIWFEL